MSDSATPICYHLKIRLFRLTSLYSTALFSSNLVKTGRALIRGRSLIQGNLVYKKNRIAGSSSASFELYLNL